MKAHQANITVCISDNRAKLMGLVILIKRHQKHVCVQYDYSTLASASNHYVIFSKWKGDDFCRQSHQFSVNEIHIAMSKGAAYIAISFENHSLHQQPIFIQLSVDNVAIIFRYSLIHAYSF